MACDVRPPITDDESFALVGDDAVLGKPELEQYASDRRYVRNLAPWGKPIALNLADSRQYRFAIMRLRLAGMPPERLPQLFRMVDSLRAAHRARGLAVGAVVPITVSEGSRESLHRVLATGNATASRTVQSGALFSRPSEELMSGFVDNAVWDGLGNLIGDTDFSELWGNAALTVVQATGFLAFAESSLIEGDSFLVAQRSDGTLLQTYIVGAPRDVDLEAALQTPAVIHPTDLDGDGASVICLDRSPGSHCDYTDQGMATLKVPLAGSVTVAGPGIHIDWPTIRDVYQSTQGPWPGSVDVILGTHGGGCRLSMREFWSRVTARPDNSPTEMQWDLQSDPSRWASFSSQCRVAQDPVYVVMNLVVPYVDDRSGARGHLPVTITNAALRRPQDPPNVDFAPPLRVE